MIEFNLKKELVGIEGKFNLDISFSIEEFSFSIIFGKSGVGKTTILRMIAGLIEPEDGYIKTTSGYWFNKKEKINLPVQKRKIGYVFQEYALFPNMNVKDNLNYALENKKDKNYVDEILELFNLKNLAHIYPDKLSGGQKQKVALARAIVRKPDLLLLDEPLSALDLENRNKLQDELKIIHERFKITTIMITHDLSEVFRLANKVFLLENGIFSKSGSPSEVFIEEKLSSKFKFIAKVIEITKKDIVYVLTVLINDSLVKVVSSEEEISDIKIGDNIIIFSKAFNPMIMKI